MTSIRLGDLLVKAKVISDSQLKAALHEQQKWGGRLGELLVRMSFVTEDMLVKALSKQLNIVTVNLDTVISVPPHVRAKIPQEVARDLVALPLQLRDEGKTLVVVMAEPQNLKHIDTLRSISRCKVVTQIAGRQSIARAFSRIYEAHNEAPPEQTSSGSSFKLVDAQGNTVIKAGEEVARPEAGRRATSSGMAAARAPPSPPPQAALPKALPLDELPSSLSSKSPSEMLRLVEESQRKEVAALKGMVELMIEKGVFTREEYLAKVKR
jgi:hypothetical protein